MRNTPFEVNQTFEQSWKYLLRENLLERNPYVEQNKIPLGTRKPFNYYPEKNGQRVIPDEDIVYLHYDPIDTPFTERSAFNILILGGSGDSKSLTLKNIWWFLHEAGYYCIYIDSKSTDSGRAQKAWNNSRMPPNIRAKGIKLKHYLPVFSIKNYEHLTHNFYIYSLRLSDISEREMWQGLNSTTKGASKVTKIIKEEGENITLKTLNYKLQQMFEDKEINSQSLNSIESIIVDLEDFGIISEKYDPIDLMDEWKNGYSVVVSYNSCSFIFMTFDIGMRIHQAVRSYFSKERRKPVFFMFDDSSYYAKEKRDLLKFNFAINEIRNIGFNYRSLGIYCCLVTQTLGIIDENVAEAFRYKIITPSFNNPASLANINVPKAVIDILTNNGLYTNKEKFINEYILIYPDNSWVRCFPFNPCINHFVEIYKPK